METYLCRVVSLTKTLYSLKNTGDTQEVVAENLLTWTLPVYAESLVETLK